jgi:hypothetical protein
MMAKRRKRRNYVRSEDALQFLHDALRAPPKSKQRQALLEGALLTYYFGLLNPREDRRGRPKGTTGVRHKRHMGDDAALRLMTQIAAISEELGPYALARRAVDSGHVAIRAAHRESVIKRLAARWKQSRAEK